MSKRKPKQPEVMGRAITLDDGREVGLYMLGGNTFGWRFVSKAGDVTQITLSREAMNAVLVLHNEATWGEWKVTHSPQTGGE
jgi:hypothetical protein